MTATFYSVTRQASKFSLKPIFKVLSAIPKLLLKSQGKHKLRHDSIFVIFVVIISRCSVPGACDLYSFKAAVWFMGPGHVQLSDL